LLLSPSMFECFGGWKIIPSSQRVLVCIGPLIPFKNYVRMLGRSSNKHMNSDISNFTLMKYFDVNTRVRRVKDPIQVEWNCFQWIRMEPYPGWMELFSVNTDGAAKDTYGLVASVRILFLGIVWVNMLVASLLCGCAILPLCCVYRCHSCYWAFYVEFINVILTIEHVAEAGYRCL